MGKLVRRKVRGLWVDAYVEGDLLGPVLGLG